MPSLGEDLSDLRKKENLTLKNIFDSTRIPIYILKSIEDASIFKDPNQNKTYVRSFIRTYAKTLNISEKDIIKALDETYNGKYNGLIAKKYGLSSSKKDKDKEGSSSKSTKDYSPKFSLDTPEESSEDSKKSDEEDSERNELYNPNTIKTNTGTKPEYSEPDQLKSHNKKVPEPPKLHNVNWAEMGKKTSTTRSRTPVAIIAAIVVIVILGASYFVYTKFESTNGSSKQLKSVLPVDTLSSSKVTSVTSDSANSSKAAATVATLPDTLHIVVYAAYKKLEPVRIRSDLGNRLNPYWIEKGQAMRFRFLNDIYIRGQYKRMMILFRGHPIPNILKYRQNDGTLHFQRALFEKHKDWWKPLNQGPLPNGVPWPSVIHDTPIF